MPFKVGSSSSSRLRQGRKLAGSHGMAIVAAAELEMARRPSRTGGWHGGEHTELGPMAVQRRYYACTISASSIVISCCWN